MRPDLLAVADDVLERVGNADAEVTVVEGEMALTRFALNAIHQNVAEGSLRLRLRLVAEDRVGVAELRSNAPDAAGRLVASAERARRLSPAGDVTPLPAPSSDPTAPSVPCDAGRDAAPDTRADAVAVIARMAVRHGMEAFGALSTSATRVAVVNTRGVRREATTTSADFVTVVRGADGAGYADRHSCDIAGMDMEDLAAEVVDTCARNQNATPIDPGPYEVVLAPYAVADLLEHLSWSGFSAMARHEGRSFMRPGVRLMSDRVSIDDDALDAARHPFPFDAEGVASRPVSIIDRGVCRDLVHDTATALRDGVASTGHALPMPNPGGPQARHLALAPGDSSVEDLIAATERGLFVTRLWYVRSVHPLRTIVTGMTREGTFLIEKGKLRRPVRDLRFTQSIVEALGDVRGIGRDRRLHRAETENAVLVPHLHLGRFAFTS